MADVIHKLIIIGGGVAGLTAAIYAGRAELKPLLFAGSFADKGGLLVKTSTVENFPGFPDGIQGYDLISNMEEQAVKCGAVVISEEVVSITSGERGLKLVIDSTGTLYRSLSVVIATGSKPNKLGLPREDEFWSKGISSCAVCDGALYKGKRIVVVGGGDSAMEEASFLTKFSKVTLIHRGTEFNKASVAMRNRVLSNPLIECVYESVIRELQGKDDGLERIVVENIRTNERSVMDVDGLFYGLGLKPNTLLFKDFVERDSDGYIKGGFHLDQQGHGDHLETGTSVDGVFVAGDAHDKKFRQAIVAAGDGCKAAMEAIEWLQTSDSNE